MPTPPSGGCEKSPRWGIGGGILLKGFRTIANKSPKVAAAPGAWEGERGGVISGLRCAALAAAAPGAIT